MTTTKKNVYFASDMHFGIPDSESSLVREKLFVRWLDDISADASDIFIMGDLFDFWFEWKHVVPKGYIRLLGKMTELSDKGIRFHFFTGNHDMWMFSYFEDAFSAKIYRNDTILSMLNKTLYLSHGDGLGPGDHGYKFIKKLFRNKLAQWCYARLHPNFAVMLANFFSHKSRYSNTVKNSSDNNRERQLTENQIIHARTILKNQHIDYFIFGHQHTPVKEQIKENSILYNIGNWFESFTYLKFEDGNIIHMTYKTGTEEILQ